MFISISIALIALSAGILLLAKTNKDNLGLFYKTMSLFIIICSFLVMGLSVVCGIVRFASHGQEHERGFHKKHKHHHRFSDGEMGWNRNHNWNNGPHEGWGRGEEGEHGGFEHHGFEGGRGFGRGGFEQHDGNQEDMESRMNEHLERSTKHLSEKLNLNADQQKKLHDILKSSMDKEKEIWAKSNGNREEFKKLSHENHQNKTEAIKKILTPEQLKQFDEQEAERMGEHHRG